MKRQSKPEKIKKEKSTAPGEWLYFAPANVTVRSIYEVLTDDYEVEIWEDAGVLEIGLNDGATLDIEWTKIPAKDEITAAFDNGIFYHFSQCFPGRHREDRSSCHFKTGRI